MTPVTALDIAGLRASKLDDWGYHHSCIWCGAEAWAGRFHSQCVNAACSGQVAAPLDTIATTMFAGDYEAAGALVRRKLNIPDAGEKRRAIRREVLDFWLKCCTTSPSSEARLAIGRLSKDGKHILGSRFGATILDRGMIDELIKLAERTGASFPESWLSNAPLSCAAFCVQTDPCSIDRIVLLRSGPSEVVWDLRAAGVSGLIGLMPYKQRLLAADFDRALELQNQLTGNGYFDEVASVFIDPWKEEMDGRWYPEAEMLTAVVDGPEDIIAIQATIDKFPLLGDYLRGVPLKYVAGHLDRGKTATWDNLRVSYIRNDTPPGSKRVSADSARLFEQTGSKPADATKIINGYRDAGHMLLADDFQKLAANRIIRRDQKIVVRETSGEYTITTPYGSSNLTNFHLKIVANVLFRDRPDQYCRGLLTCGDRRHDIVFPRAAVTGGKSSKLQEALHTRLVIAGGSISGDAIPTVIDSTQFQRFVSPYLNNQIAHAPSIEGISRLGWSFDRKVFHAPGLLLTVDGREYVEPVIYPGKAALTVFDGVSTWSDACPADLPQPCQDVIAMLLAMCVRHYRRCLPRPTLVLQSSDSVALLEGITRAMGQRHVFELGQNVRDTDGLDGVHGYPFVASGYGRAQAHKTQMSCVILTDEGYHVASAVDPDQIADAGRALQYALIRVAEWCLATGADDFKEVAAMERHTALMLEGQWLIKNVCDLQPWEVSSSSLPALDHLFAQIPRGETKRRMSLLDGTKLTVDLAGVAWDRETIEREVAQMGASLSIDGDVLTTDAAALLPALERFYGMAPDLSMVTIDE